MTALQDQEDVPRRSKHVVSLCRCAVHESHRHQIGQCLFLYFLDVVTTASWMSAHHNYCAADGKKYTQIRPRVFAAYLHDETSKPCVPARHVRRIAHGTQHDWIRQFSRVHLLDAGSPAFGRWHVTFPASPVKAMDVDFGSHTTSTRKKLVAEPASEVATWRSPTSHADQAHQRLTREQHR